MGKADYYAAGQWNFYCDLCGAKNKSSDGRKTWDGFWVCAHHKEQRNPQDFVKGVKDDQTVPWNRAGSPDQYVPTVVALTGVSAVGSVNSLLIVTGGSVAATGVMAAGSLGTVGVTFGKGITQVAAATAVGSLGPVLSVPLTGVAATGVLGNLSILYSQALTQVAATGAVGSVGPVIAKAATQVAATGAVGALAPSFSRPLTQVNATGALGTMSTTAPVVVALTGVAATGAVGSVGVSFSKALTQVAATGSIGSLGLLMQVGLTQVAATGATGTVTVSGAPAIPGVIGWYDASVNGSITQSGGTASQWNDISGNGNHWTQGTGASQPTVRAGAYANGLALQTLDFNGSQGMSATSFTPAGDTLTVFMAINTYAVSGPVSCMLTANQQIQSGAGGGEVGVYGTGGGGGNTGGQTGVGSTYTYMSDTVAPGRHTWTLETSSVTTANNLINADGAAQTLAGSATPVVPFGITLLCGQATYVSSVCIGEIIICGTTGAMSGATISAVEAYLKAKWGTP